MNIKNSLLVFITILLLTGCGNGGVMDCSDAEQMKTVTNVIEKTIPKDSKVENVHFVTNSTSSSVGTGFTGARVYFDTSSDEHKTATVDFEHEDQSKIEDNKYHSQYFGKNKLGRTVSTYDYSQVAANINKAEALLKEKNIEVSGIDTYIIQFFENPKDDSHSFDLLSKSGSTKFTGRKISTEYLVITCEADSEGNITFPDLEE